MQTRALGEREETGKAPQWALTNQIPLCTDLLEVHLLAPLRTEFMPELFMTTPIARRGPRLTVDFILHPFYSTYAAHMDLFEWDTAAATLTLRFKIAGRAVFDALVSHLQGFASLRSVSDTEVELQFASLSTQTDFMKAVPLLLLACTTAFVHPWLFLRLRQRLSRPVLLADEGNPICDPRTGDVVYNHKSILRHLTPLHRRRVDLHYYYRTPAAAGNPPSVLLLEHDRPRVSYPLLLEANVELICDDVCARMG